TLSLLRSARPTATMRVSRDVWWPLRPEAASLRSFLLAIGVIDRDARHVLGSVVPATNGWTPSFALLDCRSTARPGAPTERSHDVLRSHHAAIEYPGPRRRAGHHFDRHRPRVPAGLRLRHIRRPQIRRPRRRHPPHPGSGGPSHPTRRSMAPRLRPAR